MRCGAARELALRGGAEGCARGEEGKAGRVGGTLRVLSGGGADKGVCGVQQISLATLAGQPILAIERVNAFNDPPRKVSWLYHPTNPVNNLKNRQHLPIQLRRGLSVKSV